MGCNYDVFPAYTILSDGTEIYGIGYSDYSECYTNEDETERIFTAGFISYYGEEIVPKEEFDEGLILYDMDFSDETTSFVLAYQSETYKNHCVVYGQYVRYGIDENGQVTYQHEKYKKGECDEELGSLYSYDESRFVFENEVGQSVRISAVSLYSNIDYDELQDAINDILRNQDKNFVTIDIESAVLYSQEAVESYLGSLQEETFLGYRVEDLIREAENLDLMECYRLTEDGLKTLTIEPGQKGESTLVKWLIGSACVLTLAVSMVGSMVCIAAPPLSAVSSGLAGFAIEIFMQVVVSGEKLNEIDWGKVVLAVAAGAVSGFLGPYVYATTSGAAYFFVDSALDGLIGGIEKAVTSWLEGGDGMSIVKSLGYGFALGFGLSGAFKGVGALVGAIAKGVSQGVSAASKKLFPKLTGKVSAFAGKITKNVSVFAEKIGKKIQG